jgi:hypothetical protein
MGRGPCDNQVRQLKYPFRPFLFMSDSPFEDAFSIMSDLFFILFHFIPQNTKRHVVFLRYSLIRF